MRRACNGPGDLATVTVKYNFPLVDTVRQEQCSRAEQHLRRW